MTALAGSQPIWVLTSTDGLTPANANADPSLTVYEEGTDTYVATATMAQIGDVVGLYRQTQVVSEANKYAKGKTYLVHISYAISSTTYVQTATFTVV